MHLASMWVSRESMLPWVISFSLFLTLPIANRRRWSRHQTKHWLELFEANMNFVWIDFWIGMNLSLAMMLLVGAQVHLQKIFLLFLTALSLSSMKEATQEPIVISTTGWSWRARTPCPSSTSSTPASSTSSFQQLALRMLPTLSSRHR